MDGENVADQIVRMTIEQAKMGDVHARRDVWNRIDGKVPDRIAGPNGEPVKMVVEVNRDKVCGDDEPAAAV